jgi:hypothetical protein
MLDDAADVIEAGVRQIGIARAREQRLAAFPDRLMHMHARAVVAIDGLRHERRRLAIGGRDLMDDIFVDLHRVGALGQRLELEAQLVLRAGDFVVMLFRLDAQIAHDGEHLAADILRGIDRRDGEIAALDGRAVAQIAASYSVPVL